eukprot:gene35026-44889_t
MPADFSVFSATPVTSPPPLLDFELSPELPPPREEATNAAAHPDGPDTAAPPAMPDAQEGTPSANAAADNAAGTDGAGLAVMQRERDAAEAANAAKSRYLANVSHEIRSPLNAIYGYAQLLERGANIDTVEAARVIRRSAEHLTDLVEGLLDISARVIRRSAEHLTDLVE